MTKDNKPEWFMQIAREDRERRLAQAEQRRKRREQELAATYAEEAKRRNSRGEPLVDRTVSNSVKYADPIPEEDYSLYDRIADTDEGMFPNLADAIKQLLMAEKVKREREPLARLGIDPRSSAVVNPADVDQWRAPEGFRWARDGLVRSAEERPFWLGMNVVTSTYIPRGHVAFVNPPEWHEKYDRRVRWDLPDRWVLRDSIANEIGLMLHNMVNEIGYGPYYTWVRDDNGDRLHVTFWEDRWDDPEQRWIYQREIMLSVVTAPVSVYRAVKRALAAIRREFSI